MVMGKHKGNKFELKIFKDLRQYSPTLKRTIGSGSSEDDADLIDDKFIIECKHYKSLNESQIIKFWKKLVNEAYKINKTPVLVYKENNQPIKAVTWAMPYGSKNPEVDFIVATLDYKAWRVSCFE